MFLLTGCGDSVLKQSNPIPTSCSTGDISGVVVDASTSQPLDGLRAIVALEQVDSTGGFPIATYRPVAKASPTASGYFSFCPPTIGQYLVVVSALDSAQPIPQNANAYPPTLVLTNAGGNLGTLLVGPEGRSAAAMVSIADMVTTAGISGGVITFSRETIFDVADQGVPGTDFRYAVPSVPQNFSVVSFLTSFGQQCPTGTACAPTNVFLPVGPAVFRLSNGSWTQRTGSSLYTIEVRAFVYDSTVSNLDNLTTPNCTPSALSTSMQSNGEQLVVSPGATLQAQPLTFTNCR